MGYMGIVTVLWEKWTEFKRDFYKITLAAMITPVMYLIIFGIGVQTSSHGEPYLNYLIPGIVAIATMTGSFSAVAQNMSVQRLYEKALDQVMISPTPLWQFIVGQIIGGSLRGMYSGCIILLLVAPIHTGLHFGPYCFFIMLLNGMVFSTMGLTMSFLSKSYADTPKYNAYIITPMSFLCNTFFSVDQMPNGFRQFVGALPLSQSSGMLRNLSHGENPGHSGVIILLVYLAIFSVISFLFIYRKKNM